MGFAERILGTVSMVLPDYTEVCPKCRVELSDEEMGYGLAYGGGLGRYWCCSNPDCDWFVKWLDPKEETDAVA